MSERTELLPGSFCWPELATPDSAKAKAFYSGLFGWTPVDAPSSGGTYTFLQLGGKDVAALRTLSEKEKGEGIPSYFLSYVSTASADASAAKAAELGGAVLFGPFDVMGIGRMAVVRDPAGLVFALWEARGHIGARLVGEDEHPLLDRDRDARREGGREVLLRPLRLDGEAARRGADRPAISRSTATGSRSAGSCR